APSSTPASSASVPSGEPTNTTTGSSPAALRSASVRQLFTRQTEFVAASGRFTVVKPVEPTARVVHASAGGELQVALAGFPASSPAFMTVYGPRTVSQAGGGPNYPLFRDLPIVMTNAAGEA